MFSITRDNVDDLYSETLWLIEAHHLLEETRGGPVMSLDQPICWGLTNPRNRVLINPIRDANPFFHVMEFIWFMSGSTDIKWISQFSKKYGNYAEGHSSYGYRWRKSLGFDQVVEVIELLKKDPNTRRAVLQMWHGSLDLAEQNGQFKEVPCNTHIYFRKLNGKLDMTVLNRSNDIIWGALGANIVHMTMLHELIAFGAGIPMGVYRAISNNAHVYQNLPKRQELFVHKETEVLVEQCRPILRVGESWRQFLIECENFIETNQLGVHPVQNDWLREVALPMRMNFHARELIYDIGCPGWKKACELWLERRKK